MKKFKIHIALFICLIYPAKITLQAQEHEHEHSRNEIGFSGGALYSFAHHTWGGGMHLHYFRTLGLHSKWSLGGGIEQAWVDGSHFNIGAGIKYQLFNRLSIGILPGVTFFTHNETESHDDHESSNSAQFALHFELVYDLFHWDRFHMGPALDYSWTKDDSHAMIGIHAAFCF